MQWKRVEMELERDWFFVLLIILAIVFSLLPIQPNNLDFLLSALIQSMSTVFALLFTIILILIQMSDDRDISLRILFDRWTIVFMALLVTCIIVLSIGLLDCKNIEVCSRCGIVLFVTCFALLAYYFWVIANRINRIKQLEILKKWAKSEIDKLYITEFTDELSKQVLEPLTENLRKIQNIGFIACKEHDEKAFRKVSDVMLSLASEATSNSIMEAIISRLINIVIEKDDVTTFLIFGSKTLEYALTGTFPNDFTSLLVDALNKIGLSTSSIEICSGSLAALEDVKWKIRKRESVCSNAGDLLEMVDNVTNELKSHLQYLGNLLIKGEIPDSLVLSSN